MPLPIFGKSAKNPADIVRSLKEALIVLESKSASSQSEGAGMINIQHIQHRYSINTLIDIFYVYWFFIGATGGTGAPPVRDKKQEKAQEELSKHLQNTKR